MPSGSRGVKRREVSRGGAWPSGSRENRNMTRRAKTGFDVPIAPRDTDAWPRAGVGCLPNGARMKTGHGIGRGARDGVFLRTVRRSARLLLATALSGAVVPSCVPFEPEMPASARPDHTSNEPEELLSATGLYEDIRLGRLAPGVIEYAPQFPFWSDGAGMRRFFYLPPGTQIDVSNMDHWSFPRGTRFWKTFDLAGVVVETDLIERIGPGKTDDDFRFAAYAWRADGNEAELVPLGLKNARNTGRDIPPYGACFSCHGKLEERVIGFSAIQLGKTLLPALQKRGLFAPSVPEERIEVPGDPDAVAALGYLHANCGHCHHEGAERPMHLRLSVNDRTVEDTQAYRSAVGVGSVFKTPGMTMRVVPGHPELSVVHFRMSVRRKGEQMPNWGTHVVDEHGLRLVDAWIADLAQARDPTQPSNEVGLPTP
jgi:hypothetical protein